MTSSSSSGGQDKTPRTTSGLVVPDVPASILAQSRPNTNNNNNSSNNNNNNYTAITNATGSQPITSSSNPDVIHKRMKIDTIDVAANVENTAADNVVGYIQSCHRPRPIK